VRLGEAETCGLRRARSAKLDFNSGSYYLHDEYRPCREHRWIAERLKGADSGLEEGFNRLPARLREGGGHAHLTFVNAWGSPRPLSKGL